MVESSHSESRNQVAALCAIRQVGWLANELKTVWEIVVRINGIAQVSFTESFFPNKTPNEFEFALSADLLALFREEVKSGTVFQISHGVPTYTEGLGDSRAMLGISQGIRRVHTQMVQSLNSRSQN